MDTLQQPIILILAFSLFGYLLGSVSTSIITCKAMGLPDPRKVGSGNPGATNVLREGGKKAAVITLFGDMLKGVIPVSLAHVFAMTDMLIAVTGLAAFLGHVYPVYYGFKGGKGVATLLGVLIGTHWMIGLGAILIWLSMAFTFRYSSLSALVAALFSPLLAWLVTHSAVIATTTALMAALLYWRHRTNIINLLSGAEDKIGAKK
ncbi:MAG: glycerol-3-phosphate 1-O-acyltransferase PlsY [Gammaproteobacteria bacterium]|nr:glycerol-3-phosphate 1-O-acyltransferase PlsY [Gammaproteobacteria bacterium]